MIPILFTYPCSSRSPVAKWKPIAGFEDSYEISDDGHIRNIKFGKIKILCPSISKDGYYKVTLFKNNKPYYFRVNVLVARAFIQNPFGKTQVNHKNNIRNDNRANNLEWCTGEENMQHCIKENRIANGEKQGLHKLITKQIIIIRKLHKTGLSYRRLATTFSVNKSTIMRVIKGYTWRHVCK